MLKFFTPFQSKSSKHSSRQIFIVTVYQDMKFLVYVTGLKTQG